MGYLAGIDRCTQVSSIDVWTVADDQPFADRRQAGAALAARLNDYQGKPDLVVVALPRGGVPVAFEVARALGAPLDIFVVRTLGLPGHRELAMGAIASGGVRVLNENVVQWHGIPAHAIDEVAHDERREDSSAVSANIRGDRPAIDLRDKTVVLIDDGLATGSTMRAAVEAVRAHHPARVVVAVPVGDRETCQEFVAGIATSPKQPTRK